MKPLPVTFATALLRLDFDDDLVWQRVRDAALAPNTADDSPLVVIDDPEYAVLDVAALAAARPAAYEEALLIVFDDETLKHPDNPLLFIDWLAYEDEEDDERFTPGSLRITPDQVDSIHTQLALRNLDFDDFVAHSGPDGIFRGFREG